MDIIYMYRFIFNQNEWLIIAMHTLTDFFPAEILIDMLNIMEIYNILYIHQLNHTV